MSEKGSDQPESAKATDRQILLRFLERIKANAAARALEVEVPDERALEAEDDLATVGQTWLKQEITHTKQLHYVRLRLLASLFVLVLGWLGSVALLLILQGFKLRGFWLSDKAIIAYITSTTVSVLGLFHIAAKWLFSAGFADFARSLKDMRQKDDLHKN